MERSYHDGKASLPNQTRLEDVRLDLHDWTSKDGKHVLHLRRGISRFWKPSPQKRVACAQNCGSGVAKPNVGQVSGQGQIGGLEILGERSEELSSLKGAPLIGSATENLPAKVVSSQLLGSSTNLFFISTTETLSRNKARAFKAIDIAVDGRLPADRISASPSQMADLSRVFSWHLHYSPDL
ncbi:hypothetical protein NA56DRAFT_704076 [Hyaloscypha hepaticicola]|uniref:Uncharacterized protein n=1 Tax=Hyaloscypha hepaticicola TaxID=2082293 RepID=A0A2J6Q3J0_9HELO|nr:hypothetical protein NA56DRAFT_704076 [Hyaloscypha hepaticicola]